MQPFLEIAIFAAGFALGAGLWALLARAVQRAQSAQAVAEATSELRASMREQEALARRVPELQAALGGKDAELKALNDQIARLSADEGAVRARLEELGRAQEQLRQAFAAASAEALKNNNEAFLQLAKTELEKVQASGKNDLEKREKAIEDLVKPIKDGLEKYDKRVEQLDKEHNESYGALTNQLKVVASESERLKVETANLVKALRAPSVRGRWGEMQLKRVVELAGMLDHCDFETQHSVETEEGRLRPDLVVRLPGGKLLVVDAKAPLLAYLEALEAPTEELRQLRLKQHAQQIRVHMAALGAKAYWEQFPQSPEFVVMFIPGETFFSAALEQEPGLIEEGVGKQVILATPTTLIALLRAVVYGWRQERVAQNAREISQLGKELYDRIGKLGELLDDLGKGLNRAVGSYNKAIGSLEGRVLVSARRFKELGAATGEDLPEGAPIEASAREVQAPELRLLPTPASLPSKEQG